MRDYFRSEPIKYLRAPVLADVEPTMPTQDERRDCNIPDLNLWLWEYYHQFSDIVLSSPQKPIEYLN